MSAEDFARHYAVLRQLGVAADLDVPVYKNGRMTERRVTIYRAFSEQLVGQCLAPVAAGVLPSEHFAIVQALAAAGRLTLEEIEERVVAGRGERERAEMSPVGETLAQLARFRIAVPEEDLTLRQRRQILVEYLAANEPGSEPGAGVQKRGRGSQKPRPMPKLP